ncbi:hypothetical protein GCM10017673_45750 [Streptosporangium violaceochromogenes]|nr:hypothetical protein GCM10017673_45750 [Streptosporangium violaceochromogenes]
MTNSTVFQEAVYTTQFSALQLRPRTLLDLAVNGLARYMAEHLTPFPSFVHHHNTSVVVRTVYLDYTPPDLHFADAPWLEMHVGMVASGTGEWLSLTVDYQAGDRPVARVRLILRVVTVVDPSSLAAQPGRLPESLLARFPADRRQPAKAFLGQARAAPPFPAGPQLFATQRHETTLTRTHCEVADQWSFVEMVEMATVARERLFETLGPSNDVVHQAIGAPVRRLIASYRRPMFVFDRCHTLTQAHRSPDAKHTVFEHTFQTPVGDKPHLHVWEILDAV